MAQRQAAIEMVGNRYRILSELGRGGMGAVFVTHDRLTSQTIALKRVELSSAALEDPDATIDNPNFRLALAQEFRTLASLRHPNIISVLDYGFDSTGHPYYTMELLPETKNFLEAGEKLVTDSKIELLLPLLNALTYLHRRGILHRDLKPDNVLISYGQLKLLDFGLAAAREALESDNERVVGTLAYIAPEVLAGATPSEASDLYAVGVMAYELFAGHYPFIVQNATELLNQIVSAIPDVSKIEVTERLKGMISRLLNKDPQDRYLHASNVIHELYEILDRGVVAEDATMRESFLQAARFVGRQRELNTLKDALRDTLRGKGSMWLIGGESGVGKSRLSDEIRTFALIEGAVVARGQASATSSAPYQLMRDILRRLCLQINPDELNLSVLKGLIPDIGVLFDREVLDAPPLEPQAAYDRLLDAISDVFLLQKEPVVIVAEDLQWANENLGIIEHVSKFIENRPILIVGNYRSDESADLPQKLSSAHSILLSRLVQDEIDDLTAAVLGDDHEQRAEVSRLLRQETEGNVFFIVEVLRALAEDAGQLELIGLKTIPAKIFAGGIASIVRRRLSHVPEWAMPLLEQAALMGREMNVPALAHLLGKRDINEWLNTCQSASVLAVQDERWLFAHDKLREGVLADIEGARLPKLHEAVALALEHVYGDTPSYAAPLASHWRGAGNAAKEAYHSLRAGEQRVSSGAYAQAAQFLERAFELRENDPTFERLDKAKLLRLIGQARFYVGDIMGAQEYLIRAVATANRPIPTNPTIYQLDSLWQTIQQFSRRLLPIKYLNKSEYRRKQLLESGRSLFFLGEMTVYTGDTHSGTYRGMRGLNELESAGISESLARTYCGTGWVISNRPRARGMSRRYLQMGLETAEMVGEPSALAFSLMVSSIAASGWGEWETARPWVERSLEICKAIGDAHIFRQANGVLADVEYYHLGNIAAAERMTQENYQSAYDTSSRSHMAFGGSRRALHLAQMNRNDEAISAAEDSLTLEKPHPMTLLNAKSALILAYLHTGDKAQLRHALDELQGAIEAGVSAIYAMFDGYATLAYGRLMLAQGDQALLPQAKTAVDLLATFAKSYNIAEARAVAFQAWLAHLSGETPKNEAQSAKNVAVQAVALAKKYAMPYEEAFALWVSGRVSKDAQQLERAAALFGQCGAAYEQQVVSGSA